MRSKMQKLVLKYFLGFCKNMKGEHFSTSQVWDRVTVYIFSE